jgi:hypothetical protein
VLTPVRSQVDTLEVAGTSDWTPGSTIDFDLLESVAETRIDGIVGYDLLNRFAISVDYTDHCLVIYRPGTEPRSAWGEPSADHRPAAAVR